MGSFAAAGASIDQALESAKSAQRSAEYDAERAMKAAQSYQEMAGIHENLDDNNELIRHLMGEMADMRWTIQELRGEIDAIKMQMNMPASMGGYAPNGTPNMDFAPPRMANPLSDWYESKASSEGSVY